MPNLRDKIKDHKRKVDNNRYDVDDWFFDSCPVEVNR